MVEPRFCIKKFFFSATATSTGSDARVHTLCLWVLTSTKRLVGSVQSMYHRVVAPYYPYAALARSNLAHVVRRRMLVCPRSKAKSRPNIR